MGFLFKPSGCGSSFLTNCTSLAHRRCTPFSLGSMTTFASGFTALSLINETTHLPFRHRKSTIRCTSDKKSNSSITTPPSESSNAFLKVAWYGSELLGMAASLFSRPALSEGSQKDLKLSVESSGIVERSVIVEAIKRDFQRSYFVTGNLTSDAYEHDCEFADPAGSFKGFDRFKRNCTNFGRLIEKSDMKLTKWEDLESKGIGHWRFSCIMSFPWKPILSATGYTEYFFDAQSGRVFRHVEHWNVPKMALFRQLLRPSRKK